MEIPQFKKPLPPRPPLPRPEAGSGIIFGAGNALGNFAAAGGVLSPRSTSISGPSSSASLPLSPLPVFPHLARSGSGSIGLVRTLRAPNGPSVEEEVYILRGEVIGKNQRILELEAENRELHEKVKTMATKVLELEEQIGFYERMSEEDKANGAGPTLSPRSGRTATAPPIPQTRDFSEVSHSAPSSPSCPRISSDLVKSPSSAPGSPSTPHHTSASAPELPPRDVEEFQCTSDDEVSPYPFDAPDNEGNILYKEDKPTKTATTNPATDSHTTATTTTTTTPTTPSTPLGPHHYAQAADGSSPQEEKSSARIKFADSVPEDQDVPQPVVELPPPPLPALLNDHQKIRAGTLHKLVEKLTDHANFDPSYMRAFLLTYRTFCSPKDLLELIIIRWKIPSTSPSYVSRADVHFGIWYLLKTWIETHFYDFEVNRGLLERLRRFLNKRVIADSSLQEPGQKLIVLLERKMKHNEVEMETVYDEMPKSLTKSRSRRRLSISFKNKRISKSLNTPFSKLHEHHPLEVARQLTLLESYYFVQIQPRECLDQCWSKDKANAPNMLFLIERFNMLSNYIKTEVLKTEDVKLRAKMIEFWLQVAVHCEEVHNFNGLMEITSSLNASPIHRLKKTWKLIPTKLLNHRAEWDKLTMLNYAKLREAMVEAGQPCLPYLGVFLSDLTFIEEGNKDFVLGRDAIELINFEKRRKTAKVITRLQQYQRGTFSFAHVPSIYNVFAEEISTRNYLDCSDDALYQLSLLREPREKKK